MKISWNWLREFIATELPVEKAAELLTDIGLEVEGVYAFESVKGGLKGLIVGETVEVTKHPDADKLKITKVNIGSGELLNIVCGAPNVTANQKVIVATVGTTVFPIKGDPFTIKKAKIRGIESEGMLCADDEIGLGESHEGLHILPENAILGSAVKDIFDVYSDTIIEIGLTANHADANSHYGVARELAAALRSRKIEQAELNKLNVLPVDSNSKNNPIQVIIENHNASPRYSGILIEHIKITSSPSWLQNQLKAIGLRPINNVVDITNYILHAFGQPLHAFDADKIKGKKIVVKTLAEGTVFTTLDEKERKLSASDLMICDAENGICIAGVYGGLHSGISDTTTNIFLESAYFNPAFIRKTESTHGLKTDASSRFGKGTDPEMTVPALQKAVEMIQELCGGEIAGEMIDIYPEKIKPFHIALRFEKLDAMAAIQIPRDTIRTILSSLYIKITEETPTGLQLEVPSYKNDVVREIDIIEEILRMYGFNHIPMPASVRTPYIVQPKPDREQIKFNIIDYLSSNGYYEIFTNAISKSKYTNKYLPKAEPAQVKLLNSLNVELDSMRQSMLFSGLEVIAFNQNRKQTDLKLFEFGRTYFNHNGKFIEEDKLAIFITGNKSEENWNNKTVPVSFFDIKQIISTLMYKMNVMPAAIEKNIEHELFDACTEITSGNIKYGLFGLVKTSICSDFDIRQPVYFAELNWAAMTDSGSKRKTEFKEIPKYPEVRRDLALIIGGEINYNAIKQIAVKEGKQLLRDVVLFDVYEGEKLEGKKSYAIGLTFRDDEKTLTDAEVDSIMQKMMSKFEQELNAVIRK